MRTRLHVVTAAIGEGAGDTGCKLGPQALMELGLIRRLESPALAPVHIADVKSDPFAARDRMDVVQRFSRRLAERTRDAAAEQLLVLGGDHSCAVGTWSGVAESLRRRGAGPLGLLWIDAHLDAHTPQTSHSMAPHGMPLAALLGRGPDALTNLFGWLPKVDPRHVVVIGARSYEAEEHALLTSLGVRIIGMDELRSRGFAACFGEAAARLAEDCGGWGVTFDVDAIDAAYFPGTGTPVAGGIQVADAVEGLRGVFALDGCVGIEVCEYNPLRDYGGGSAEAVFSLLEAATARLAIEVAH